MSALAAAGVTVSAEWKPSAFLVSAPSRLPTTLRTSAMAASSPETITIGTLKWPAMAAFHDPSVMSTPFSATRVSVALEKVCARTPARLVVEA